MPIEDIFSISAAGRGDGPNERGKTRWARKSRLWLPRHAQDVVTGIEMFKKSLDEGLAGDNGTLLRVLVRRRGARMVIAKRARLRRNEVQG